jgi:pyruvate,water dikinase
MTSNATNLETFPIPSDLAGFWMYDRVHAPRPLTPLSQELLLDGLTKGFCAGMRELGYPLGLHYRSVNYYAYYAFLPHDRSAQAGLAVDAKCCDEIALLLARLREKWECEWLPSILPGLERLRTRDYGNLSDGELLATLDELRDDLTARWRIHGLLLFAYQAASAFDDFYRDALTPVDATESHLLLSGFPTRAFEADLGLWRISRRVRRSPTLRRLFAETLRPALAEKLSETEAGQSVLRDLQKHLDEFGWRGDTILELAEPMWRENLSIPLNALRGLAALDDTEDPEARLTKIAERREQLLAAARARLADHPAQRAEFEKLYAQARDHVVIDENHNFYIDQMGNIALRLPLLELARRLTRKGSIDRIDDVFFLMTPEIRSGLRGTDQREQVAIRRAEMTRWATVTPPATLGEPPPDGETDPFLAALAKTDAAPLPLPQTATVIRGTPASPGSVQGRAKVVRSLEEASTIVPGQILVCEMTLPAWSVVFASTAAVVADTGGVLCHCATVAREYGVPCVVGTSVGTTMIADGAMLAVDGTKGEVRVLG